MIVRWDEITGKPATFPPAVHTHHPDALEGARTTDYPARGAGAGYQLGLVRLDASAVAIVVPALGLATPLYTIAAGKTQRILVTGDDGAGANGFQDEIWACAINTPAAIGPINLTNTFGAPGGRTYSLNLNRIDVAIAGVPPVVNYNVRFLVFEF